MWPFRPEKLSDILSINDIRKLLLLGDDIGSAVTLVEALADDEFRSIDADTHREERQPDSFCTFFRIFFDNSKD